MLNLLDIIGFLAPYALPAAGAVYTYFASRSTANDARLDEITKRIDKAELELLAAGHNATALANVDKTLIDHDRRIQAVEGELKHLPDKDMVNELKLAIAELSGTVKALAVQLNGVERTVENIDGYFREGGAKP